MARHQLSKSTFMRGCQCLKSLYLNKHHRTLGICKDPLSAQQTAIFAAGTLTGELAQQKYPGGVDCTPESFYDFAPSIVKTRDAITACAPAIYEATFMANGVLALMDILVLRDDGWHAYEVKSTNSTKDQHIEDAALQYWVMRESGLPVVSIHIMHFDPAYVRDGAIDVQELFTDDDVTEAALGKQDAITRQIEVEKAVLTAHAVPAIAIGPHCHSPYACDFIGHCWSEIPPYSVLNLRGKSETKWALFNEGYRMTRDIPEGTDLQWKQQLQVNADKTGETTIDKAGIAAFLERLVYPLYYFDFETIMPGVPIFDHSRPYQQICVQYSLHIQHEAGGAVEHFEFLGDGTDADPRPPLLEQMIADLGTAGSVIVYNESFEDGRLEEMARDFPQHAAAITAIRARLIDLADPFRAKHYYAPEMRGSYSIKYVLPALIPELSYNDLAIQEGGTASLTYLQMVTGTFDGDIDQTRRDLIAYCTLDTLAMVKIMAKLKAAVTEGQS